jgi:hypothetical protein
MADGVGVIQIAAIQVDRDAASRIDGRWPAPVTRPNSRRIAGAGEDRAGMSRRFARHADRVLDLP